MIWKVFSSSYRKTLSEPVQSGSQPNRQQPSGPALFCPPRCTLGFCSGAPPLLPPPPPQPTVQQIQPCSSSVSSSLLRSTVSTPPPHPPNTSQQTKSQLYSLSLSGYSRSVILWLVYVMAAMKLQTRRVRPSVGTVESGGGEMVAGVPTCNPAHLRRLNLKSAGMPEMNCRGRQRHRDPQTRTLPVSVPNLKTCLFRRFLLSRLFLFP